ncbi:hypothetical protein ACLOJK_008593 [Asimina triloba]
MKKVHDLLTSLGFVSLLEKPFIKHKVGIDKETCLPAVDAPKLAQSPPGFGRRRGRHCCCFVLVGGRFRGLVENFEAVGRSYCVCPGRRTKLGRQLQDGETSENRESRRIRGLEKKRGLLPRIRRRSQDRTTELLCTLASEKTVGKSGSIFEIAGRDCLWWDEAPQDGATGRRYARRPEMGGKTSADEANQGWGRKQKSLRLCVGYLPPHAACDGSKPPSPLPDGALLQSILCAACTSAF